MFPFLGNTKSMDQAIKDLKKFLAHLIKQTSHNTASMPITAPTAMPISRRESSEIVKIL